MWSCKTDRPCCRTLPKLGAFRFGIPEFHNRIWATLNNNTCPTPMVKIRTAATYFGILLVTASGVATSTTQSSPCYFSSLRINLESSRALFEESMEWAKEWKADGDCQFRANGFRLLALQSSRTAGGVSNLPFTGPSRLPVVEVPSCDWNSIRAAYARGMAATIRALKLLGTIQCFEQRTLNTTILQQKYNNALAEYAVVSMAINTALENCATSPCDRLLNRQILDSCHPMSCSKCQVIGRFTGIMRETAIRAQEAFQYASSGSSTCCLAKATFATNVYRLMSFVYMSYKAIAESLLPPPKKESVPIVLPTCWHQTCDQKNSYACTLYSQWGFCNITFEEFYTALNMMDFAGESITCCPESSQEAIAEVNSQVSRLQVAAEKYGLYLASLNSICLNA